MASRPPRAAFSVSRRLSERDRREPHFPGDGGPGGSPIGGMVDALRGLIEQLSQAAGTPDAASRAAKDDGAREFPSGSKGASAVFGYTLRMGLDGLSAERFGDVPERPAPQAAAAPVQQPPVRQPPVRQPPVRQPPVRQPIVEVFEEAGAIVVIAELPGADSQAIVCRVDGRELLIEAAGARRYRKQVELPAPVHPGEIRQRLQNGILEVRLTPMAPA